MLRRPLSRQLQSVKIAIDLTENDAVSDKSSLVILQAQQGERTLGEPSFPVG